MSFITYYLIISIYLIISVLRNIPCHVLIIYSYMCEMRNVRTLIFTNRLLGAKIPASDEPSHCWSIYLTYSIKTHWGRAKMAAISQTTF